MRQKDLTQARYPDLRRLVASEGRRPGEANEKHVSSINNVLFFINGKILEANKKVTFINSANLT